MALCDTLPHMGEDGIPRRVLGRTGEQVTIVGLGGEGILRTHGHERDAAAVITRALDLGVKYFDTAPAYASSRDYLGASLGERRKEIFLASKTAERSRDGSMRILDDSLRRLRTDHLDLWQLHDLRTLEDVEDIFAADGAIHALTEAREQGRVRYLGITGHHDPAVLLEAMRRFEFDTVLAALNCADLARMPFSNTVLTEAARRKMGVIAMKVYSAGILVGPRGSCRAEEALRYALSLDGVSLAILGCHTPEQVEQNVAIARGFVRMRDAEMRGLEQRHRSDAWTPYKAPPWMAIRH
jgi:aryl-alcohol dehydrogenase-like predicted oxidoreductase